MESKEIEMKPHKNIALVAQDNEGYKQQLKKG